MSTKTTKGQTQGKGDAESNGNGDKAKKTPCPITREDFRKGAKPLEVVVNGVPLVAEVKEFSTGSLGWYLTGKTTVKVGDTPVSVQIGMNLTIVNSKEVK